MNIGNKQRESLLLENGTPRASVTFDVWPDGQLSMWTSFKHGDDFADVQKCLEEMRLKLDQFIAAGHMCPFGWRHNSQHTASLAVVVRHKGETPKSDYVLGAKEDTQDKGLPVVMRSLERQRDELRAENERLRSACQEMNHALSRCAYLCGEPNEQECSWYDVEPYPQAAIEAVQKMRDELVKLRAQIAEMK